MVIKKYIVPPMLLVIYYNSTSVWNGLEGVGKNLINIVLISIIKNKLFYKKYIFCIRKLKRKILNRKIKNIYLKYKLYILKYYDY